MSQAAVKKKSQPTGVILPEEQFWKCYSPQNEFPLSSACSVALHGLVLGGLVLLAYVWNLPKNIEAIEPPRMDVVEVSGGGGTGGPGGSGFGPAVPGKNVPLDKINDPKLKPPLNKADENPQIAKLETPPKNNPLKVPETKNKKSSPSITEDAIFGAVLSDALDEVAKSMNLERRQIETAGLVGGSPGSGGGVGGGQGKGFGSDKGPGDGTDPKGVLLSKRQKREMRWLIQFSGDGKEHLKKLKALQITLAIPTANPGWFQLVDLSGPAPKFLVSDLKQHADKVKWFNVNPESLGNLAQVLNLVRAPKYVVIFLPDNVEKEMVDLEYKYKNAPEHLILYTRFEITKRDDGSFGPVVIEQKLKDGATAGK